MTAAQKDIRLSLGLHAAAGLAALLVGLGGAAAFAVSVDLASAVVAGGTVVPDGRSKVVQHLEGGLVAALAVRDGDRVGAGAVLVSLDDTRAGAAVATLKGQLAGHRAVEARLAAEAALRRTIDADQTADPEAAARVADQAAVFSARWAALDAEHAVFDARRVQLADRRAGLVSQRDALRRQADSLEAEARGLEALVAKGFATRSELEARRRETVRLAGLVGEIEAQIAANRSQADDLDLQKREAAERFRERATAERATAAAARAETAERLRVAEDALSRLTVRAPVSGVVQGLALGGPGAVVRPGEPLLQIVPDGAALTVAARVPVTAADEIEPGMTAELHFPAFERRAQPTLTGSVTRVSADALVDPATGASFYLADIALDPDTIPARIAGRLKPGMPAEVIVPTRPRSLADYLVEPLMRALGRSMRET